MARLFIIALLAAAFGRAGAQQDSDPRATFDQLVDRHIATRARLHPEWATSVGLHTDDGRLDARDAAAIRQDSARAASDLRSLVAIDTARLDGPRRIDWLLMYSVLESAAREAGLREWQRRPGFYIPFTAVYTLAVGTEPDARTRMASITTRLQQWPTAFETGRRQIVAARTPQFWVDLEIGNARRIATYLRTDLPAIIERGGGDVPAFAAARDVAVRALERYTTWMADTLRPAASGAWQLGEVEYDWRLTHTKLLDTNSDSLIALGFSVLHETLDSLTALARQIDPARTWQQLADSSKTLHPSADGVFAAYSAEAARARTFIIDRHLFTVPPDERLDMVLTPPHLRQTYAYGGYSPAAPFEKTQVGHFFVTPVEDGATPAQIESKLRGHNYGWITLVAVHEGYPGHHLQYVRAAQQPSKLRKIYNSEVFGEGWGLYSEQLMYEQGFYPSKLAQLTLLRMRLWRAARVIIDPSIHTGQMSFDDAVSFFVDSVGLERADATAEVTRYTTWPTQAVSYILGLRAIQAIRDEARDILGRSFDLTHFHDVVLQQASLPPPLLRRAVLNALGVPRSDSRPLEPERVPLSVPGVPPSEHRPP